MSLGDPGPSFHKANKRAYDAGIIIVAATGNENTKVSYPKAYPEVIAVGAIRKTMDRANFSNFGNEVSVK